jgi:hypothetical protein
LRPKSDGGQANFYSVVTRDTKDQDFAVNRQRFLTEQGYQYTIVDAAGLDDHSSNRVTSVSSGPTVEASAPEASGSTMAASKAAARIVSKLTELVSPTVVPPVSKRKRSKPAGSEPTSAANEPNHNLISLDAFRSKKLDRM